MKTRRPVMSGWFWSGLFVLAGCDGGAAATSAPAIARAESSGVQSAHPASVDATAAPDSSSASAASASAASASLAASASAAVPPEVDLDKSPELVGADGEALDQTKDEPAVDSPAFQKRLDLLWRAIVTNDPSIAEPAFFPSIAYERVKDIKKPKADWKHRLMKNFHRDIRAYHKKLGDEPRALEFVGVDVDAGRVKWMDPGKEGNKLGYYRVTRSKIRYKDPSGKESKLELTSLISWRGEWFIVHLHGFK